MLKIENIKIEKIKPYKNNAKKHTIQQIKQVAESIKRFSWVQPIVIDKNNEIIIGHCRYEAAKLLKLKEVPIILADKLTEKEIKALRLADNKLNESVWDMSLAIDDLKLLDNDLLILTGFNNDLRIKDIDFDNIESTEDRQRQFKDELVTCPHCNKSFNIKI